VGIGKPASPTPGGRFYVRERLVPADKNTVYGVFAFGTSAFSNHETDWPGGGIIGVHGTNQPELIPGRVSHGCVRIVNDDIRRLKRKMPLGTPILIR
jgi:lipoprotein-anchoring transpeptidase ErfK/SrfK